MRHAWVQPGWRPQKAVAMAAASQSGRQKPPAGPRCRPAAAEPPPAPAPPLAPAAARLHACGKVQHASWRARKATSCRMCGRRARRASMAGCSLQAGGRWQEGASALDSPCPGTWAAACMVGWASLTCHAMLLQHGHPPLHLLHLGRRGGQQQAARGLPLHGRSEARVGGHDALPGRLAARRQRPGGRGGVPVGHPYVPLACRVAPPAQQAKRAGWCAAWWWVHGAGVRQGPSRHCGPHLPLLRLHRAASGPG